MAHKIKREQERKRDGKNDGVTIHSLRRWRTETVTHVLHSLGNYIVVCSAFEAIEKSIFFRFFQIVNRIYFDHSSSFALTLNHDVSNVKQITVSHNGFFPYNFFLVCSLVFFFCSGWNLTMC